MISTGECLNLSNLYPFLGLPINCIRFRFIQGLLDSMEESESAGKQSSRSISRDEVSSKQSREVKPIGKVLESGSTRSVKDAAEQRGHGEAEPKLEDYAQFEDYIDALVSFNERASSTKSSSSLGNKDSTSTSRTTTSSMTASSSSSVDDEWLKMLAGEESSPAAAVTTKPKSPEKAWRRPDVSSISSSSRSTYSSNAPAPKVKPQVSKSVSDAALDGTLEDLESFLDSLGSMDFAFDDDDSFSAPIQVATKVPEKNPTSRGSTEAVSPPSRSPTESLDNKKSTTSLPRATEKPDSSSHLSSLTVKELKELLKQKELPLSGKKADMIARLTEQSL